ncbi:Fibrillin-2, partial [Blattella germanica]
QCICRGGYQLTPNRDSCVDIDECQRHPNICNNGTCANAVGSYKCHCYPGFKLSHNNDCIDIDECRIMPFLCRNGRCRNVMGSFHCECADGYVLASDGQHCRDVDECHENAGICEEGACVNTDGGVICECPEGYILSQSGMKCVDVREELCYDSFFRAEFNKLCPEGPGRGDTGEDLNECTFMPNACDGGDCINTDGSFRCECPTGYVLDETGKKCIELHIPIHVRYVKQICEDVNECQEMGNQCAFRCHNVPGSFRCICPYGYTLAPDGRHCQDVDECVTPANTCKYMCKNLIGTFMCICPEGYQQFGHSDDCRDINECVTNPNICRNGNCVNLQGSYRCDCYDGFEPSHDHKQCIDRRVGYCFRQLMAGRCTTHTDGLMSVTRADCCCTMGAAWGPHCEICPSPNIDECNTIPDLCRNGRCINTLGSYRCICNKGYKPDHSGTRCLDVNECSQVPSPCKYACQNTDGSFICSCPIGFVLNPDGVSCRDLDECATRRHVCQHECINTQGSYKCSCPKGYNQVGDQCTDINECSEQTGTCPPPGNCINTLGSFKCICPRGFKLDSTGTFCTDTDECTDDSKCPYGYGCQVQYLSSFTII